MNSFAGSHLGADTHAAALRASQVPVTGSLRDVLEVLDRGALGIGLAVSSDAVLKGVLTDGDVRRALLGGGQ